MIAGLKGKCLIVPPLLCAETAVYAAIRRAGSSAIDTARRFDKRFKQTHRLTIADTRGRLDLTVPIVKPESSKCRWDEILVSTHGAWWDVHRTALESAYGRTPFFEFYIDRLLPMLTAGVTDRYPKLIDLTTAWDRWIRKVLLLPTPEHLLTATETGIAAEDYETVAEAAAAASRSLPYWQVRSDKLGFIPGLSILDLIFNTGPEATLHIDRISADMKV